MAESITFGKDLITGETEDEPPGCSPAANTKSVEDPPGTAGSIRKLFGDVPDKDWNDWKWQFRNRITHVEDLIKYLPLKDSELARLKLVTTRYPVAITPHYLSLINPQDPDDPVRKQAVPSFEEIALFDMGKEDPLGEQHDSAVPGLVHRNQAGF